MSLLQNIILASYATSAHHKMALDAQRFLQGPNAAKRGDLLLNEYKFLLAAGIRNRTALSQTPVAELLQQVFQTAGTTEGKCMLRSGAVPDEAEVTAWITAAQQTATLKAA